MRTEKEILSRIKEIEEQGEHVLRGSMATVFENAPRALMQLGIMSRLDGLYFALGKTRPRYEYEKKK